MTLETASAFNPFVLLNSPEALLASLGSVSSSPTAPLLRHSATISPIISDTLPTAISAGGCFSLGNLQNAEMFLQMQHLQQQLQANLAAALLAMKEREKLGVEAPAAIIKPIPVLPSIQVAAPVETLTARQRAQQHNIASRNKLGRSYNPGRPLAMEERQRILDLYEKGHKISHIARIIGVTHSCVSKIMTRFRRTGSMHPRSFAGVRTLKEEMPQSTGIWQPRGNHSLTRLSDDDRSSESDKSSIEECMKVDASDSPPITRLSVSPDSAFSVPISKRTPPYSIESLLHV